MGVDRDGELQGGMYGGGCRFCHWGFLMERELERRHLGRRIRQKFCHCFLLLDNDVDTLIRKDIIFMQRRCYQSRQTL